MEIWFFNKKPEIQNGKMKISSTNGTGVTGCQYIEQYKLIHRNHPIQNSSPSALKPATLSQGLCTY